jgi:lipopolysaccharide/colanic/teichoic acid biosynthesis glycosyltransferase
MMALKRALDAIVALVLLVMLAPLLALICVAVCAESGTPVIFYARRLGKDGQPFTMYKFRTMARGAAVGLAALTSRNLAQGMVKIVDDPRATPLGRILRRFSLDELPQLWNVVRGDMSLVGPRPHEVSEVSIDDRFLRQRLTMRPGLTGMWQINARTNPSLKVRIDYDLAYISHWSMVLDLAIALRTIPVVLRGEGGRIMRPTRSVLQTSPSQPADAPRKP